MKGVNKKDKILKACAHAVKNNKKIVKTFWSYEAIQKYESLAEAIPCPTEINPLLSVAYFLFQDEPKTIYSNSYFVENDMSHPGAPDMRKHWRSRFKNIDFNKYWNHYSDEWAPVEEYLECDKAWICGFINGWLYSTRQKTIRKDDLAIIPEKEKISYKEGFSFSKEFRPLVTTIAVKRSQIEKKTQDFIKWSIGQGLKPKEIKTIVDEALAESIIAE